MPVPPQQAVAAYYRLRQALGALGLMLPPVLILGTLFEGDPLPPALSDFIYTPFGGYFAGTMFAIGVFLITYVGYGGDTGLLTDRRVSTVAGLGAIAVALFPNDTLDPCDPDLIGGVSISGLLHVVGAGVFLISTAVFCFVLFRRGALSPSRAKQYRNTLYTVCGLVIVGCILGLAVYFVLLDTNARCALRPLRPVLWLETLTVLVFGLAWLVKGRGVRMLNDPGENAPDPG